MRPILLINPVDLERAAPRSRQGHMRASAGP
jgi:hypothetical protein